ncbi:MAG TPA: C1 family peptidase [Candidatus Deferrimicrobium sp.]|nr:C1 family peptidase [Candidatus Deferrimicrobium sp.]
MKKLLFGLLVVCVCVIMIQADRENPRDFDRDGQIAGRLAQMRATLEAEGHTFEIGMNEAMNYSLEQLCTLKPELAAGGNSLSETQEDIPTAVLLPTAYTGFCGTIRNQGSCGSCWAYAIIGQIEAQWRKVIGTYYDFSEQFLIDCNTHGYSCNGGWFDAYSDCTYPNYFKYESCYVHGSDCLDPYCDADYCSNWYYVGNSSSVPATSSIKQRIYDKGAVAAAVYCDSYMQAYVAGCFTRNAPGAVNHAIVLCGWNDNQCGTGIGAWKVKNSWGTGWGMSGYIWIKYGCQQVGYAACYGVY